MPWTIEMQSTGKLMLLFIFLAFIAKRFIYLCCVCLLTLLLYWLALFTCSIISSDDWTVFVQHAYDFDQSNVQAQDSFRHKMQTDNINEMPLHVCLSKNGWLCLFTWPIDIFFGISLVLRKGGPPYSMPPSKPNRISTRINLSFISLHCAGQFKRDGNMSVHALAISHIWT